MIDMRMLLRIEFDFALVIQPQPHRSITPDALDSPQIAIGNLQFLAGRGELDTISCGEPLLVLSVYGDSNLTAWIIGGLLSVPSHHRQSVRLSVHSKNPRVFAF